MFEAARRVYIWFAKGSNAACLRFFSCSFILILKLLVLLFAALTGAQATTTTKKIRSLSSDHSLVDVECSLVCAMAVKSTNKWQHMCFNSHWGSLLVESRSSWLLFVCWSFWSNKEAWSWLELELITNLFVSCLTRRESNRHKWGKIGRNNVKKLTIHSVRSSDVSRAAYKLQHMWKLISLCGWYFHSLQWLCWF